MKIGLRFLKLSKKIKWQQHFVNIVNDGDDDDDDYD